MWVDVAGATDSDDGVDEQFGLCLHGGAHGELVVRVVHRVACLESDHAVPASAVELFAQLSWGEPQVGELPMLGRAEHLEFAADVPVVGFAEQVFGAGVCLVGRSEYGFGLGAAVRLPGLGDPQRGEHHAFRVAQGEGLVPAGGGQHVARYVKGDRHGPQGAVGEPHAAAHRRIVLLPMEGGERGEAAAGEHLQVAQLALRQRPAGPTHGPGGQLVGPLRCDP